MTQRIGIDIGGTFTDLVAITADGRVITHKIASTPHDYCDGIIDGLRALLARHSGTVADVLHGTTIGSNTILEGKGARTALITTKGFRDILEIRDLRMPVLYDLHWTKPRALVERRLRLEVIEKLRPDGSVATALDAASVAAAIDMLRREDVQSVAICLLHSYANPAHERAVAEAVRAALPDVAIFSVSHEILPEIKEYPRTSTTVINAYVQPVVRAYVTSLASRLHTLGIEAPLQLMQSNGGLASVEFASIAPAHIIESGPAAGLAVRHSRSSSTSRASSHSIWAGPPRKLVLGYLDPAGLVGGTLRLDAGSARAAIARSLAKPLQRSVEEAAYGMLRLASASMMRAIRAVSVERGRDPRQFALLAFGGNGPLFAAAIATELGISRIIVPPLPGVFSAFGLLVADTEHHASQSLRVRLDEADAARIASVLDALTAAGSGRLARDGFPPERRRFRRAALARYVGQSSEIEVRLPDGELLPHFAALFAEEHERNYGFRAPPDEPVELIGLSVLARGIPERPRLPDRIPPVPTPVPASRVAWFPDIGWHETPVADRSGLGATPRRGPLIIQEYDATCLVPHGFDATRDPFGNIRLVRST